MTKTYIMKVNFVIIVIIVGCISFTSISDYFAKGRLPKKISNEEIYPKGTIKTAKVFDENYNEKLINLNQNDVNSIIKIIKSSNKKLVNNYGEHLLELNIQSTDSAIQLVRQDDKTIYYVFHGGRINAICYKVESKELSDIILKASL